MAVSIARHGDLAGQIPLIGYNMTFQLKTVQLREKGVEIVMFGLVLFQF